MRTVNFVKRNAPTILFLIREHHRALYERRIEYV